MKTKIFLAGSLLALGMASLTGCPTWVDGCAEGPCGTADGSTPETGPGPDVSIPIPAKTGMCRRPDVTR
jgi:hypothetical protein